MFAFHEHFDHRWFDSHPFAIVDASWRDEIPAHWPGHVISPAFLGGDTDRCPVLLDLSRMSSVDATGLMDLLQEQVAAREDTVCSLLLAASCRPEALVRHLASRLSLSWPRSANPVQFRFFDPGTFLQLPRLLDDDGLAWLMGPVREALTPWAGQWTVVTRPNSSSHFRIADSHRDALLMVGVVNRVAMQLNPPESSTDWMQRCQQIEQHAKRGMYQHSLVQQSDLVEFAVRAMRCHPAFDSHPSVLSLLRQLRIAAPDDELDLPELFSRLDSEEWEQVRQDLINETKEHVTP